MATHKIRFTDWMCTRCGWRGDYSSTRGVRYRGVDWQHCPSCNSIAIPKEGSTEFIGDKQIEKSELNGVKNETKK